MCEPEVDGDGGDFEDIAVDGDAGDSCPRARAPRPKRQRAALEHEGPLMLCFLLAAQGAGERIPDYRQRHRAMERGLPSAVGAPPNLQLGSSPREKPALVQSGAEGIRRRSCFVLVLPGDRWLNTVYVFCITHIILYLYLLI